jgi:hypothetical protein
MVSEPGRNGFCCLLCKFFLREQEEDQRGQCRRHAPCQADTYGNGLWPFVETTDFCGQGVKS